MQQVTFVTMAVPGPVALQALLLARSMREFGGTAAMEPIWALVPDGGSRLSRADAEARVDTDLLVWLDRDS